MDPQAMRTRKTGSLANSRTIENTVRGLALGNSLNPSSRSRVAAASLDRPVKDFGSKASPAPASMAGLVVVAI